MAWKIGIGHQDFEDIRTKRLFYIDKTDFIREWWEGNDSVTLITRPRRFGKTLNMSMTEQFFSIAYAGRGDLFEGLSIWEKPDFRDLQGTYPVISLSFADVKEGSFVQARKTICRIIKSVYRQFDFLLEGDCLSESEKADFLGISAEMEDSEAAFSLKALAGYLYHYYGKKVIILLDEYDTPMQEAYVNGYWKEMAAFVRSLFNSTFKTNPFLERAIMTGITRVNKESIFSDLNNLTVVTTTSEKYEDSFGFTEEEVFASLSRFGLPEKKGIVKDWYDGFTFGRRTDIYNPWSITNFLDTKTIQCYWANTSSNGLAGKLIREGNKEIKQDFEQLIKGAPLLMEIDEQIVYDQLPTKKNAVWSLLLASGYLRVLQTEFIEEMSCRQYLLTLTNKEVRLMFEDMVQDWFSRDGASNYNDFIKALLADDITAMNLYMNRVAMDCFSYFDTGNRPSGAEPERFYHGFVLGLMVTLRDRYHLTSNRESGFGRYDVMLEPKEKQDPAVILEFKIQTPEEPALSDTAAKALEQIEEKQYETALTARGIPKERIRKYGFAFHGKNVLIRKSGD